jgi:gliding motility-associated-like protein
LRLSCGEANNPLDGTRDDMKRVVLPLLFCLGHLIVSAQDFSNKGKEFWLGYGYHVNMPASAGNSQEMVLYFTSDKNATVKVEVPGIQYSATYIVTANQVTTSSPLPKTGAQDSRISAPGVFDRGIHITSDVPVVAYAHIYNASVSGASLLFPTNTLGKDYYSVNFTQSSNATNANSFFFVVATEDNTSVEITPSAANLNGLTVNSPTIITLNKGQVYNVMGTVNGTVGTDLTGSRIRSVSTNGSVGCKKIAVFSGAGKMSIGGVGSAGGSADNLFAQAFPAVAWGKKYLTAPTGSQPNNFYRVCVTDPNTVVKLNGVVIPRASLVNNFYYQFKNSSASNTTSAAIPNIIESDIPVLVAQYCTTQGQEGNPNVNPGGDPEMIYLSPVEQTINNITLYSATANNILQSYINVILKTGGVSSFKLDGLSRASNFQVHPGDANYSYAIFTVAPGSHALYSDTGFNAIAYGFGSAESYGYNAGTNVKDFSPTAVFQNQYSRLDSAITCVNTPLQFAIPLNFVPATLQWDFTAAPNISPSGGIGPSSTVVADSSKSLNGQTVNYYSPGKTFVFINANTAAQRDTIKLYTTSSTPDGCGSTNQMFSIPVTVRSDLPISKFTITAGGCINDPVKFTDQSTVSQGSLLKWLWDFGDGSTADLSSAAVPDKAYGTSVTHTVKLKVVSDIGCLSSESSQSFTQSMKPTARFTISNPNCVDSDIKLTDASTIPSGTLAKWKWTVPGVGNGEIVNAVNSPVLVHYTTAGPKDISLRVSTSAGCESDAFTPTFAINPSPAPNFGIPEVCLSDAFAQFTDSTKIADGSESLFKWSWNFNTTAVTPGPSSLTSTLQNPQVKYNKSDNYKVSLTVTSKDGCAATLVKDFTVNGSIPKAAFEFANTAPYCGTKLVKIQNNSTVDFGTVTRLEIYWDYGNNPTVKETDENPTPGKLYAHSYADPTAPKLYSVRVVAYSGGSACSDVTSKTFTLYPQPKAAFTNSISQLCTGETVTFTDKSNGVSSAAKTWNWDLGKGSLSSLQNPSKQYNDSGLIDVSMYFYNADGCISDTAVKQLTVYPNPVVGLKQTDRVLAGGTITITPLYVFGNQISFKWTPATYLDSDYIRAPKASPVDDITYKLTLTAQGGCTASDAIFITVLKGPEVPNAFSPNGDGINDTWKIKYLDSYPDATVEVYSRSGQIVFRSTGYSIEWDGTYKGSPLPVGTYYYIINPRNTRPVVTGSVTIIK